MCLAISHQVVDLGLRPWHQKKVATQNYHDKAFDNISQERMGRRALVERLELLCQSCMGPGLEPL